MTEIIVQRGAGDLAGPDIEMSHWQSEAALIAAGRAAIDRQAAGLTRVSGVIQGLIPFVRPGAVIRHDDLRQGECRAKVEDFSGVISHDPDGTPHASIGLTMRRQVRT